MHLGTAMNQVQAKNTAKQLSVQHKMQQQQQLNQQHQQHLGDLKKFDEFAQRAADLEDWIREKSALALDDGYKDLKNLAHKGQRHKDLCAEVAANKASLESLQKVRLWLNFHDFCFDETSMPFKSVSILSMMRFVL